MTSLAELLAACSEKLQPLAHVPCAAESGDRIELQLTECVGGEAEIEYPP